MVWQGIYGHDRIVEQFRVSLAAGRLPSTFLFVGPPGVGKHTFALKLAAALLCDARDEALLDPCGRCDACREVDLRTHPDLELVSKPPEKNFIPVETFIGDREHRMREGLCHNIAMKPLRGGRKIAIIDDADFLNAEGANCLLKTLEEPPPRSVLILIGTSQQRQLPTIRSRSQVVRFAPLEDAVLADLLLKRGVVSDPAEAEELAALCQGSQQQADELADEELRRFRGELFEALSDPRTDSVAFQKQVVDFVEAAGKEAPARRQRIRQIVGQAVEYYRQRLRASVGAAVRGDGKLLDAVGAAQRRAGISPEAAADALDRSLDTLGHVAANANVNLLVESWIDDVFQITRRTG